MSSMGGSCSLQRQRALHSNHGRNDRNGGMNSRRNNGRNNNNNTSNRMNNNHHNNNNNGNLRDGCDDYNHTHVDNNIMMNSNRRISSVRHSVDMELPDRSISNLYPIEDNYYLVDNHEDITTNDGSGGSTSHHSKRSPKSLVELCTDAVCRSLPYLDGELPPGLPQDVVDDIVHSLMRHSALNATTLRSLKNCELGSLSLVGCRGVTDEWLQPLSSSPPQGSSPVLAGGSPCFSSIASSSSSHHHHQSSFDDGVADMELDTSALGNCAQHHQHYGYGRPYTAAEAPAIGGTHHHDDNKSASSCSTSSFVSASSTPYVEHVDNDASNDHDMLDEDHNTTADHHHQPFNFSPQQRAQSPPAAATNMTPMEDFMMTPRSTAGTDVGMYSPAEQTTTPMCSSPTPTSPYHYHHSPNNNMMNVSSLTSHLTLLDLRGSQRLTDRGLLQLSDLSLLEVVKLDHCHSIVGKGLLAFSSSHGLHTLSLANCRRLTDEAIINISHLISLQALSVDGCRCLTDRSLAAVSGLYELRKLDLSQCDLITNDGIEQLYGLEFLEELSLAWCRCITDHGVSVLVEQPGRQHILKVLRLARCPITDEGIQHIGKLTSLEELDLNGCANVGSTNLGNNALEKLTKLTTLDVSYCPGILRSSWQGKIKALKTLELCYSSVRDAHLSRLSNLPALEELNLDSCPVGDWAIAHLADNNVIPNITSLDLADTDLTDLGMAHLPKFQSLTRLSLFYCNITNAGLRHLSTMTNLEVLNLDSREIGDDGLRHLRNLIRLRALDIFSGRITDVGCGHISKIKSLESLELCGGGVGDLGCTLLASLDNLTSLNLSQNERITNRGAAALAALSNLKALNLSNTRVNSQALRFLSGLVKLQSLALYGCRGIEDGTGLDHLQNELPSLKCLRLNNSSSDDDGIVSGNAGYDEDDDDDDDDDDVNDTDDDEEEEVIFQPTTTTGLVVANPRLRQRARTNTDDDESFNDSDGEENNDGDGDGDGDDFMHGNAAVEAAGRRRLPDDDVDDDDDDHSAFRTDDLSIYSDQD